MVKTEDLDKEILYDKDGIQLIVRKDKETNEDIFIIVENDSFVTLPDLIFNRLVKIYTDRWTP